MEKTQRKDKELREAAHKRREKGGPKYVYFKKENETKSGK